MKRRRILQSAIFGVLLSGCLSADDDGGEEGSNPTTQMTATPTGSQTQTSTRSNTDSSRRVLDFGDAVELENGARYKVTGLELGGATPGSEITPSQGMQHAFLYVYAENTADEVISLPRIQDFHLLVGDRQYENAIGSTANEGDYSGGGNSGVAPGVVREGWIFYELPQDVSRAEITVLSTHPEEAVYWTVPSGGSATTTG